MSETTNPSTTETTPTSTTTETTAPAQTAPARLRVRTDVHFANGKLSVRDVADANSELPLPKVGPLPDALMSPEYGRQWLQADENDLALVGFARLQSDLAQLVNGVIQARESRDPSITQARHLDELNGRFESRLSTLASQADRCRAAAQVRLEHVENEFKNTIKWSERDAQELRAVLRAMSSESRQLTISEAVQSGDGALLAAVLSGHPVASGVTAEQQKHYRSAAMQRHAPQAYAVERTIRAAQQTLRQAFDALLENAPVLTAAGVRAKFAEQAQRAAEARKKFGEVL